jgi:integrase/recombinase XerC
MTIIETRPAGGELQTWQPYRLVDAAVASKAESTRKTYFEAFADFGKFLDTDAESALQRLVAFPPGPANTVLLSYQEHLLQRQLSPATCNLRLAALRSVVRTARRLGITTLFIDVPGLRSESYRDLSGPPADRAQHALATLAGDQRPKGRRDLAMVKILLTCGLRRAELLNLDTGDVDLDAGKLMVRGKGKRQKAPITIPAGCVEALKAWLAVRGTWEGPLFTSMSRDGRQGRLTGRSLWSICKGLLGSRVHGCRHFAITAGLTLTNGDVRSVRAFSRHSGLGILTRYDDCRLDRGAAVARLIDASLAS